MWRLFERDEDRLISNDSEKQRSIYSKKTKKKKDTEKQRLQDRVKERAINSRDGGWGGMGEVIGEGNINVES